MNRIEGIKAIAFDADGTLWDFQKVMRNSLKITLKELRRVDAETAARLDIEKMVEIRNRVAEKLRGKTTNLEEVRLEAFRETLRYAARPDDALAVHLNETYLKHRFDDIELYPDVLPALNSLKERFTIGLLSNGNSYPEKCGLGGMFEFVVFSQDCGVEKPNPRIFQIALEQSGCARGELLNVGDSLRNDIIGAMSAGLPCVWLNRDGIENRSGIRVEYEIRSLLELPDLL
jgi:putative hydrolase of the HAD superfamily